MLDWFSYREELEKLQERYSRLMRKSYETALKDLQKSDTLHREACAIKKKIKTLQGYHWDGD